MDGSGQGRMGNVAVDNGGRAVMRCVRGRVVVRRHRRVVRGDDGGVEVR